MPSWPILGLGDYCSLHDYSRSCHRLDLILRSWRKLFAQKMRHLASVKSLYVESHAERVVLHVSDFYVSVVEETFLINQDILTQVFCDLFIFKYYFSLIHSF